MTNTICGLSAIRKNWAGEPWSAEDQSRLQAAFREGGRSAARRAFPDRSLGSILSAVRRYCFFDGALPPEGAPNRMSRDEVRARLGAIPLDLFAERIEALMHRRVGFLG